MAYESAKIVLRFVDQVAQLIRGESLTENRGGLQSETIVGFEIVHPCEDDTLNRSRNLAFRDLLGTAQKLFEEQWIAAGAFHAARRELFRSIEVVACKTKRLFRAKRSKINGCQGSPRGPGAPARIYGIALDARRHHRRQPDGSRKPWRCGQEMKG